MSTRNQSWMVLAMVALLASPARGQQHRNFRPEVEQLVQRMSERLEGAAEKLGLTGQQRQKIHRIAESYAEKYQQLRSQRRALLQEELEALGAILTDEQREKAKTFIEDRLEVRRAEGGMAPRYGERRDTLRERLEAAAGKLGLTDQQRYKIRTSLAPFAERHRNQQAQRRKLVEAEFRQIADVLTPEQRQQARHAIEERAVIAPAAQMLTDRLQDAAKTLGLTDEQRVKIHKAVKPYVANFRAAQAERRALLQEELKALSAILTDEQREKVQDFFQDRVVIVDINAEALRDPEVRRMLRETVSERLEAAAEKLGVTDQQRQKIRQSARSFAEKYRAQREHREAMRRQQVEAIASILTPEQRRQVHKFIADRVGSDKDT